MTFDQPTRLYTAASQLEADQLAESLEAAGINCHVVEDRANAGLYSDAILWHPQVQVFVEADAVDQAAEVVQTFEAELKSQVERQIGSRSASTEASAESDR